MPNLDAAAKSRDGVISCLFSDGRCVRITSNGKELKSFNSGRGDSLIGGIDVPSNNRIVISQPNTGMVIETDGDGKVLWQARTPGIATATRLPNGNMLVASQSGNIVTELDRTGRVVWEYKDAATPYRARRR
jgi:outer membrane protein assembly factor BamB